MPVLVSEEDEEAVTYICDVCGAEIEQPSGAMCPKCGRLYCNFCLADHPLEEIKVRETGSEYKKKEVMCSLCATQWRKKHPPHKEMKLDGYL